jgi:cytochrome c biogenesis factor
MWLGRILVWMAMLTALMTAWHYWRAETQRHGTRDAGRGTEERDGKGMGKGGMLSKARRWYLLMGITIVAATAYLWWLILTQRYEVAYVHDYTNRELPTPLPHRRFVGRASRHLVDLGVVHDALGVAPAQVCPTL